MMMLFPAPFSLGSVFFAPFQQVLQRPLRFLRSRPLVLLSLLVLAVLLLLPELAAGSDLVGGGTSDLQKQWQGVICRILQGLNLFRRGIMFLGVIGVIWIGLSTVMDKFNARFAGRLFAFFAVLALAGHLMVYLFPKSDYTSATKTSGGYANCTRTQDPSGN